MQKLTITNSKNQSLVIGYSRPYWLANLIGLSSAPVDTLSTRGYQQDGQTAIGQFLQARPVSFSVTVTGDSMTEVYQNRRILTGFLTYKDTYTAVYENDYMTVKFDCRVSLQPEFASAQSTPSRAQTCAVGLILDNPYLVATEEITSEMGFETPYFEIPVEGFEITDTGIEISLLSDMAATVDNVGDVSAPLEIHIAGGLTNPTITNDTTGEFIKINKVISADEELVISTGYGNKRVEIINGGVTTNAFAYIDLTSTFFELQPGENLISYTADAGASGATVTLYYTPRYVGV